MSRPGTVLRGEHLKMADEVGTRFKSVKLHHYWPCTVCGGHTGGVHVLNPFEDGTVGVNCLKENYNRAATEREFAFIKYNSIL
jgi:hypothetical protein